MAKSILNRTYGWIPDRPDIRDRKYSAIKPKAISIPQKVDLRSFCSTVEDQGSIGSCTAQALAGNIELIMRKYPDPNPTPVPVVVPTCWQRWLGLAPKLSLSAWTDVSRLFIYYNERELEGTTDQDAGAYIRDGIKTLCQAGYCFEATWPYNINKVFTKPSALAYQEAQKHKITSYSRIDTLDEMLTCLAEGYPFVFGITLYESFESSKVRDTGVVDMPKPSEGVVGGHAVCAVGYDIASKRFIVRNSWGDNWGKFGYFTIPFEYLVELGADFWTIRNGSHA